MGKYLNLVKSCAEVQSIVLKSIEYGVEKNRNYLVNAIQDLEVRIKEIKATIPRPTISEMADVVVEWFNKEDIRTQFEFKTTSFDQLVIYSNSVGRIIRNEFNLWFYTWEPQIRNGADHSPEHPDAVSMRVIEEVWRRINEV